MIGILLIILLSGGTRPPPVAGHGCAPRILAITNSQWADLNGTVAAPTRTVGYQASCGGAWERIQPVDTAGTQYSAIMNQTVPSCNPVSFGCCVKGTSGSGTTDIGSFTGAWHTAALSYTSTATWFSQQNQLGTGLDRYTVGNLTQVNGGTSRSGVDFEIKGCSIVCGATITPQACK